MMAVRKAARARERTVKYAICSVNIGFQDRYSELTGEVVGLIRHTELSSEEDRDEQHHVRVLQLPPDGLRFSLEVGLLHVRDLRAVTSVDFLRLREQKCTRGAER